MTFIENVLAWIFNLIGCAILIVTLIIGGLIGLAIKLFKQI